MEMGDTRGNGSMVGDASGDEEVDVRDCRAEEEARPSTWQRRCGGGGAVG